MILFTRFSIIGALLFAIEMSFELARAATIREADA